MKALIVIEIDENHLLKEANELYERLKGYNCELKPMPKELVYEGYDSPNKQQIREAILQSEWGKKAKGDDLICIKSFSIGYNACLEEIEK